MSMMYKNSMKAIGKFVPNKLEPLWNHPADYILLGAGIQVGKILLSTACSDKEETVQELGLVIAGLGDLQRPASKISVSQSGALGLTGLIWTRYSLAITPKNWSLFSVNLFVAFTALYQVARAIKYQRDMETQGARSSTKTEH